MRAHSYCNSDSSSLDRHRVLPLPLVKASERLRFGYCFMRPSREKTLEFGYLLPLKDHQLSLFSALQLLSMPCFVAGYTSGLLGNTVRPIAKYLRQVWLGHSIADIKDNTLLISEPVIALHHSKNRREAKNLSERKSASQRTWSTFVSDTSGHFLLQVSPRSTTRKSAN